MMERNAGGSVTLVLLMGASLPSSSACGDRCRPGYYEAFTLPADSTHADCTVSLVGAKEETYDCPAAGPSTGPLFAVCSPRSPGPEVVYREAASATPGGGTISIDVEDPAGVAGFQSRLGSDQFTVSIACAATSVIDGQWVLPGKVACEL
jgi:hypothetical protein